MYWSFFSNVVVSYISKTPAQLLVQHAEDDPLGMIVVEKTAAAVDGERNEVGIQTVINDPATAWHRGMLVTSGSFSTP
jgi:hypothetical protein